VFNSTDADGCIQYYDGRDDAVINVDGNLLITHELLYDFLHSSAEGRLSFAGYWRARKRSWELNFSYFRNDGVHVPRYVESFLTLIKRPFMESVFLENVLNYIQLTEVDYDRAFSCACADEGRNENVLTAVYDNCCKFLQTLMLRYPHLAQYYQFIIDALHHSGHTNCSPTYNHKMSVALKHINAAINEQKNKLLRNMEISIAFMGQIRAAFLIRHDTTSFFTLKTPSN
jgi:hypothetical protein